MVASELLVYEAVVVCKSDNRFTMKFLDILLGKCDFDLRNFFRKYDVLDEVAKCAAESETWISIGWNRLTD